MKRICSIILTLILLLGAVGINVTSMYCGDAFVGVEVGGMRFLSEQGADMDCCASASDGCPHCRHQATFFRLDTQYCGAQTVLPAPEISALPLWASLEPAWFSVPAPLVQSIGRCGYSYIPPPLPDALLIYIGLRAPPIC